MQDVYSRRVTTKNMNNLLPPQIPDDIRTFLQEDVSPLCERFLYTALDKGDVEEIKDILVLWVGEARPRSAVLSEHLRPSESYPKSRILLHIDAIAACSVALGEPFESLLALVLMREVSRWFTIRSKGLGYELKNSNDIRAESFARDKCRKLFNKGMLAVLPPDIQHDEEKAMSYMLWLRSWSGMSIEQWRKNITDGDTNGIDPA